MQASAPLPQADLIGNRYELADRIGEGNFSVTYRARDSVLGRTVAVKMLRPQYAADATFVTRFEREAQVAASISHPNVVDVYDFGAYRDTFYIVMQYVPGQSLKQALAESGRLAPAEANRIGRQILDGLSAIHAAGIIHRDIKPHNVLLGRDGQARVTDFGVALGDLTGGLTSHGTTVGTASYMAPEQARGASLTPATDLYAVGVLLYELLTDRLPFPGDNPMAVMLAHIQEPPPPIMEAAPEANIPPALAAVVMRALAKNPSHRYPDAATMAAALTDAQGAALAPPSRFFTDPSPVDAAATTQLPAATEPQPSTAVPAPAKAAPVRPAAPLPTLPVRRRRERPWLAPLAIVVLAVLALGGVVLANRDGGNGSLGNRDPEPTQISGIVIAPTATVTATVIPPTELAPTVPATVTPLPTSTETPSPTPPAATATPSPEPPTSTPSPTATTAPTETPTPSPTPTVSSEDVPAIIPSGNSAPASDDSSGGTGNAGTQSDVLAQLSAGNWQGGATVSGSWYRGQPSVAIYGANSAHPAATITFTLASVPASGVDVYILGSDDEDLSRDVQLSIQVNGTSVYQGASPYQDCVCTYGASEVVWREARLALPAAVLVEGTNRLTVTNQEQVSNSGGTPYVLLSDVRVQVSGSPQSP